jgi:hypothetical protein
MADARRLGPRTAQGHELLVGGVPTKANTDFADSADSRTGNTDSSDFGISLPTKANTDFTDSADSRTDNTDYSDFGIPLPSGFIAITDKGQHGLHGFRDSFLLLFKRRFTL